MGLFDKIFKKKEKKTPSIVIKKDDNHNTLGQSLDKLIDGELPWGWVSYKKDFIRPRDDKLTALSVATSKARHIDEEIVLLKKFIDYYYEYKNECSSMGECYYKYFCDMYMHCFNSKCKDFEFVKPREERLKYIQDNYETLIQEDRIKIENETKKQTLLKDLDLNKEIESIIIENPGIIQSDLYKKFDPVLKDEISFVLYNWAKNGQINREKSGNSYKLTWN